MHHGTITMHDDAAKRGPGKKDDLFGHLTSLLSALGTLWILGLMILVNTDIFGRAIFSAPIAGVPELVAFSIVGIVFLQLANTLRTGAMTRSDILLTSLEHRFPRVRRFLLFLFHLTGGLLLAMVAWKLWPSVAQSWLFPARHFMGNPGFFTIPQWPLFAIMLVGIVCTALQFLIMAFSDIRFIARGEAR